MDIKRGDEFQELAAAVDREHPLNEKDLDDLTGLNNELTNAARRLAKENALIQAARMAEIEHLLSEQSRRFGASVAHMINNTMMKISGAVEILSRHLAPDSTVESNLRVIRDSIEQSSHLIDRILLLEADTLSTQESFVIDRTIQEMASEYRDNGIAIELDLRSSGGVAYAHRRLVEVALRELLDNAVEATAASANRQIRVGSALAPAERTILISVSDNGPGVHPDVVDRIYEPFESGRSLGRGLGLAIVRQVVRTLDGQIDWHRDGDKTVFTLALPHGDG